MHPTMLQHQSAQHELPELVAHIFSFQVFLSLLLLCDLPKCAFGMFVCVQDTAATAGVVQLGWQQAGKKISPIEFM